jgi:hypothetical protein
MPTPTPTPAEKTLKRVLLVSVIDGWSVIGIAALGMLLALALGDLSSLITGLLLVAAGIVELRGRGQLLRRNAGGMRLLVRAQLGLLAVILVYCVSRLGSFDEGLVLDNLTPEMEAMLKDNGLERADIVPAVRMMFYAAYGAVALVTVIFQGGLALYYRSRTAKVTEALAMPPVPVNHSVL